MFDYALPVMFALFLWWFSTGAILWVDGLPRRTHRWSMLIMTLITLAALYGLVITSSNTSIAGAYCAFTCALLVWAWHELSFLTGFVTGPRRTPCPPDSRGWTRFRQASETVIHHELAIAATLVLIAVLTWGAPNQLGLWTFVALWAMRLSTKLNIFLGVANVASEFLPPHMKYLETYFRRRPINLLFPFSVTISTVVTVLVFAHGFSESAGPASAAGAMFLGALLALAVLEHWFLVLPIPATAPWRWAMQDFEREDFRWSATAQTQDPASEALARERAARSAPDGDIGHRPPESFTGAQILGLNQDVPRQIRSGALHVYRGRRSATGSLD